MSQTLSKTLPLLSAIKAASDETRVRILHILSFGAFSVNEVVEILGMGQSRISRHLKILTDAGLVQTRKEGSLVYSFLPDSKEPIETQTFARELVPLVLSYKEDLPFRENDQRMVASILEKRERKTKGFFDRVAGDWESLQAPELQSKAYLDWILSGMPSGLSTIVDLGCGPGVLIPYLLPKSRKIVGVDSSEGMIRKAEQTFGKNPAVQFISAQLEAIPLPENSCDAVVASMVLHHISHPPAVLEEVFRILKPGGTFFLIDLEKHNQEYMRDSFFDLWLGFEKDLLESWILNSGLSIEISAEVKTDSFFRILQIKATKKEDRNVHSN